MDLSSQKHFPPQGMTLRECIEGMVLEDTLGRKPGGDGGTPRDVPVDKKWARKRVGQVLDISALGSISVGYKG